MSSASQPLQVLLPTTSPLPPVLINLTSSLLAQSRLRAANLKADEEIARPFACAEIACKRLRARLRLPPTSGRPPCKPSVYKKLLGFLEKVLDDEGNRTTKTPEKVAPKKADSRKRGTDGELKKIDTPVTATRKKLDFVGTIGSTGALVDGDNEGEAPSFVMPLIRKMCTTFGTPLLAPHVFTGTCVALKLSGTWPRSRLSKGKAKKVVDDENFRVEVSALTIAMYLMVLTRMQEGEMTTERYTTMCAKAGEVAELGTEREGREVIDQWIKRIGKEGWCREQEWWESVPEGVLDDDHPMDSTEVEDLEDVEISTSRIKRLHDRRRVQEMEDDPNGVLLPGLGTMMQDAVDWLSEEREEDYRHWKENILQRLKVMEGRKGKQVQVY